MGPFSNLQHIHPGIVELKSPPPPPPPRGVDSKCLNRINPFNPAALVLLLGNSPLKLPYMSTFCAPGTAFIWTIWCILGKTVFMKTI